MDDIYDHSFVSTIQHHVHHISNRSILKESYKEFEKLLIIIYTEILNFICKYKSKQRVLPKACVGFDSLYEGRIQKL
jgi:hypothetical protein